jgi:hypothetical protein
MTTSTSGYDIVYTKFITLKNGRRIYASSYGLKAFRLRVRRKRKDDTTKNSE